ncbi:MAG: HEPN domain-containing protein [Chloroflexi bacterium]|nr:HEPN domain-containing protein [Chloroflexota bacterium]
MPPDDPRAELVRQWLTKVQHDLVTAERMSQPPAVPDAVVFHAQQAAEKALKAFLMWHNRPFRRTHLLQELVDQCADIAAAFDQLSSAAALLTPFAVQSRYPDDLMTPDDEEASQARVAAYEVVTFVHAHLPREVYP